MRSGRGVDTDIEGEMQMHAKCLGIRNVLHKIYLIIDRKANNPNECHKRASCLTCCIMQAVTYRERGGHKLQLIGGNVLQTQTNISTGSRPGQLWRLY